ncbi:porin [Endozoicomonas numazuensis]|uniref:porin n=1 Tax=Endozoicomonas numazuensis TaxID=1137799 RepID=UPI000B2530BB|nr:porin [Endozoicomonas numazuensis]
MHKKILAVAVAATVAGPAMALEVYDDGTDSLSIGGKIGFYVQNKDHDEELNNDCNRINFEYAHKFASGWTGQGVMEWRIRTVDEYESDGEKKDFISNRLGFVGLSHDDYGSFIAGKNWSVTYDVSGWTDSYAILGGNAMGVYEGRNGGDYDGTARADDALQYRNSFGGLNIGLQYQLQSDPATQNDTNNLTDDNVQRDHGYGIALSYELPMGLSVGATYNETQYEDIAKYAGQDKSKSATAGLKYENEGLYLAAVYGEFHNKTELGDKLNAKSNGLELYGRLALNNVLQGFSVEAGYNDLKDDSKAEADQTEATFKEAMVGAIYETGPMQFAVEYAKNDSKNEIGKKDADNTLSLQARYYF